MYKVIPYKSVEGLCFGDSIDKANLIFGDSFFQKNNFEGGLEKHFKDLILVFKTNNCRFNECIFHSGVNLALENHTVDWSLNGLLSLCKKDGKPMEYHGTVVLFSLGVALTGLEEGAESDRTLTAFAEGEWDGLKDKMQSFVV